MVGPSRRRILIADELSGVLEPLVRHFSTRSPGYEVFTAHDGLEAGRIAATCEIDVLLTDVAMPGIDPLHLIRVLRANPATAHVSAVVMAGDDRRDVARRALESGAVRCFPKPVDSNEMSAFIDSLFETESLIDLPAGPRR